MPRRRLASSSARTFATLLSFTQRKTPLSLRPAFPFATGVRPIRSDSKITRPPLIPPHSHTEKEWIVDERGPNPIVVVSFFSFTRLLFFMHGWCSGWEEVAAARCARIACGCIASFASPGGEMGRVAALLSYSPEKVPH